MKVEMRVWLPLLWLAVLLAAAFLLPDRVWNTLLLGFGGMFGVAFLWARELAKGLSGARRLRFGWVAVGDLLEERFSLTNTSYLPALWVEVLDASNVPGYRTAVVRSVSPFQTINWRETAVCLRRGQFNIGPWTLRTGDPFGIFIVTHHYPSSSEIIIHPPIHGQIPIPLPAGQSNGRVRARQQSWLATLNAATVRSYQPHDPQRWIHWPTSARRGSLYVRQFDLDAAGDIWLVLDLETAVQLGRETLGTEEHAVLLAASLAARGLRQNRGVGLATYGQTPQIILPGQGQGQQWKLLRALALVAADGQLSVGQALQDVARVAQRGAAAVIITPTDKLDWLPQLASLAKRGIESNVILLERGSFGGEGKTAVLQDAVRQLGFYAQTVRQGEIGLSTLPSVGSGP